MEAQPSKEITEPWVWAYNPGLDKERGSRAGKWLVYVPSGIIDRVWREYAAATEQGLLGAVSKCSTAMRKDVGKPGAHVIVVYTADYEDEDDVRRVLRALRTNLRVGQVLSYKTNEATLASEYGPGVSLYVSQKGSLDMERR